MNCICVFRLMRAQLTTLYDMYEWNNTLFEREIRSAYKFLRSAKLSYISFSVRMKFRRRLNYAVRNNFRISNSLICV